MHRGQTPSGAYWSSGAPQSPQDRADEVPGMVRGLFRLSEFRTRRGRCGKVILVTTESVRFYERSRGDDCTGSDAHDAGQHRDLIRRDRQRREHFHQDARERAGHHASGARRAG